MSVKKIFINGFAVLATLSCIIMGSQPKAFALDNAYFSLSGSGSYTQGSTFTTDVRINAGDPAISFQADIHYDAAKLECVDVNDSGTAFPQSYNLTCGGGSASIAATTRNKATVTSPSTVAHLTFKALAASGSTAVTFTGTGIFSGTDGHNMMAAGANSGAAISFTTPAPAAPVTGGQGGGSNTPAATNGNSPASSSNGSNGTANNNAVANSDGTAPATGDTPAATNGEVKSDATKQDDKKAAAKKPDAKKSGNTVWSWILLIVLGAAAVAYGLRNRKSAIADSKAAATNGKLATKVNNASKIAAVTAPVATGAKKASKKEAAKKPATQNREKSVKKAGKKSR